MDKIVSGFLRRVRQSTSVVTGGTKKSAAEKRRMPKLSFEEWQALNPGGTFKEYTAKLPFEEWEALNPNGTFKEYYVASVLDALAGRKCHATLGPLTQPGSIERAESVVDALIGLGVERSNIVVDYGCGTLRVGRKMIQYLEPSHYVGLDVDRRILNTGLEILPPGLAEEKTPVLEVIDDDVLDRVAAMRPDWIFTKGVLHHVPPAELREFFGSISRLAHSGTKIVVLARLSDAETQHASDRTWFHSLEGIISFVKQLGFDAEVCTDSESRRMVRLQRSASAD
jgi:SAM-dependent methyltransferase